MKKILGLLAVTAALASCSVLDQKVTYADGTAGKDDPIGLKGKVVTVSLLNNGARTQGNVSPLAVTTTSGTFGDIDVSSIPSSIQLKTWGFELSLTTPDTGAVLTGAPSCPSTITVTLNSASINVKDPANATGQTVTLTSDPKAMTLTETATDCTYGVPATPIKIKGEISLVNLASLKTILTSGGTNTVTASIDYTISPAIGGTMNLAFGSGTGFIIAGI